MIRRVTPNRSLAVLLFGLILTAATPLQAQEEALLDQIALSTPQREQIKTLREQFVRDTEPLRSEIRRLVEEEKKLKSASSPSEAAVRRKLQERADKEIELSLALMHFREKLEGILNAQQRRKLDQLKSANRR